MIPLVILVSSANDVILLDMLLVMSVNNIMKRMGPSTVPCGTLLITGDCSDVAPFAVTVCVRPFKKLCSQIPSFPVMPRFCSL